MDFTSLRTTAALLLAAAAGAAADEVLLRNGGRVRGVVVETTPSAVVIETSPGRVTLPLGRVERIVQGRSALDAYRERAEALAAGDAAGWAALARWAAERELITQSRQAWQRVLALDPGNAEANAALGRVDFDGVWMAEEDAYRARGFVAFEGRWLTPQEHEALVREREVEAMAARELREADLRVREAEARVREAEARAREAEAAAQPVNGGIPYGWGWGGGFVFPPFVQGRPGRPGPPGRPPLVHPAPVPKPEPAPRPTPRPSTHPERPKARPAAILPPPPPKPRGD